MAVTCYLDESATDGATPVALVGGVILNSQDYELLAEEWEAMLGRFSLSPSFHMKDFGLHGRLSAISSNAKADIFRTAASIISARRIYTLSVTLSPADYKDSLSDVSRKEHSLYELCFLGAAISNGKMAKANDYHDRVAFVLDSGNAYAEQVRKAHQELQSYSKSHGIPSNVGSLAFEDDEQVSALQAADIVCWAARRKASGSRFFPESKPIEELISDETSHHSVSLGSDILQQLEPIISRNILTRDTK